MIIYHFTFFLQIICEDINDIEKLLLQERVRNNRVDELETSQSLVANQVLVSSPCKYKSSASNLKRAREGTIGSDIYDHYDSSTGQGANIESLASWGHEVEIMIYMPKLKL